MNWSRVKILTAKFATIILAGLIVGHTSPDRAASASLQPEDVRIVNSEVADVSAGLSGQIDPSVITTNYDALESLATSLRNSKAETSDGTWHLLIFYRLLTFDRNDPNKPPETEWQARQKFLKDWISAQPKSITARVALASFYVNYAWLARGTGDASTVSAADQKLFSHRMGQALQVLVEAEVITNQCPVDFDTMQQIQLSRGSDPATAKKEFNAANTYEPHYSAFCFNQVNYLLPRSFGDEGDWERFATKSADALGGDQGDILYARMVWWVNNQHVYDDLFKDTGCSWPRVKNGMSLLIKRYPDSVSACTEMAYLAFLASDRETSRSFFLRIGPSMDNSVWANDKAHFLHVHKWALDE